MDELALAVLKAEMTADVSVFVNAVETAADRLGGQSPIETEACAYQLGRAYNVLEQLVLRAARAFENHLEDRGGWHAELLRRLSLEIPGVRPALFPVEAMPPLTDLRGFRHIVHHAYDLTLIPERVAMVLESARQIASQLPAWVAAFFEKAESEAARTGD